MILVRKIRKIPEFFMFLRKINIIPEFYTTFLPQMPEFYIIIARNIFPEFLIRGHVASLPTHVSYAYGHDRYCNSQKYEALGYFGCGVGSADSATNLLFNQGSMLYTA